MGEAFICRRGMGGSNKSQIIVTAPTGSTVTCSNGTVTKTASERDGVWTFRNCDVGEWNITATHPDQEKPATGKVTITEDGQLLRYFITIAFFTAAIVATYVPGYKAICTHEDGTAMESDTSGSYTFAPNKGGTWTVTTTFDAQISETVEVAEGGSYEVDVSKLYLFRPGDACTDVTGGYNSTDNSTSKNKHTLKIDETLVLSATGAQPPAVASTATVNMIDMTKYSTVRFDVSFAKTPHADYNLEKRQGVFVADVSSVNPPSNAIAFANKGAMSRGAVDLDISSVSGSHLAGVCIAAYNTTTNNAATVYSIELLP